MLLKFFNSYPFLWVLSLSANFFYFSENWSAENHVSTNITVVKILWRLREHRGCEMFITVAKISRLGEFHRCCKNITVVKILSPFKIDTWRSTTLFNIDFSIDVFSEFSEWNYLLCRKNLKDCSYNNAYLIFSWITLEKWSNIHKILSYSYYKYV